MPARTEAHRQSATAPVVPSEELERTKQYYVYKERCVFCGIIRQELSDSTRVVSENIDFVTMGPYASRFAFKTWILPKRHESAFENSPAHVYKSLA